MSNIDILKRQMSCNAFKKYIDFIQFPFYRNLEEGIRLNFDFPLTVLVGPNGCGKSTSMHAIYGAPKGNTPYDFWFSTKVDPIEYYDDVKRRHSFWYGYKDDKGVYREVIKARIKRNNNPDYWETSRPLDWAGMQKGARQSPIDKKVIYLDFRAELSAFDKFMYFGDTNGLKSQRRQDFLRNKSSQLKALFDEEKTFISSKKGPLNKKKRTLSNEELKAISTILNRDYIQGESISHRIYRNEGYTVLFKTEHAKYSDAFAGRGESAVVRLVTEIINAPDYSLVLLDEPEVSLHPGAQKRLVEFLLDQIKRKKHQIVIATHSPNIIADLPPQAIKVFYQNPDSGKFCIKENIHPSQAFFYLELNTNANKQITVEDDLGKLIIDGVIKEKGSENIPLFNVKFNPGGAEVIIKDFINVFSRENASNEYIFLDGDKKYVNEHIDYRQMPKNDITTQKLQEQIKKQTNVEIKFQVDGKDGNGNEEQKLELQKKYLDFYRSNVFFIPQTTPEELIWEEEFALNLLRLSDDNTNWTEILKASVSYKQKFRTLAKELYDEDNSRAILTVQKQFVRRWLKNKNEDYKYVSQILDDIITN